MSSNNKSRNTSSDALEILRPPPVGGNPGRKPVHVRPSLYRYARAIEDRLAPETEWETREFWTLALAIHMWLRDHRYKSDSDNIAPEWLAPGVDRENPTAEDIDAAVENRNTTLARLIEGFDLIQAGQLHDDPAKVREIMKEFAEVFPWLYY